VNHPRAGEVVVAAEEYDVELTPGADEDTVICTPEAAKRTPLTIGWAAVVVCTPASDSTQDPADSDI
jgi:hypothetical protein